MASLFCFEAAARSQQATGTWLSLNDANVSATHPLFQWLLLLLLIAASYFAKKISCACPLLSHASSPLCPCPKRRARWQKCVKRGQRRQCHQQSTTDDCCLTKCAINIIKCHLPPPLPLRTKKKGQNKIPTVSETNDSNSTAPTATTPTTSVDTTPPNLVSTTILSTTSFQPSTVPLIDLARMQYWDALLTQVTRKGAKYRDADGLLPLHWACSGGPPLQVIQSLIQVYPSAVRKTDKEGSTPLHFATHYSASFSVVQTILRHYPMAAKVQDRYGRTPLYHAVEKSAGMEVIELLVQQYPKAILLPCMTKNRPDLPVSRALAKRTPLYMAWSVVLLDRKTRQNKRGRKWDKALFLLKAAYNHSACKNKVPSQPFFQLVTAAIQLDLYLPEHVVQMAVTMHPEQLMQIDLQTGRLPLLQAAAMPIVSRQRSDDVIALLLQACPEAVEAKDRDGKSALQLAVASGKPWSAGVERLFQANPDAVYWTDTSGFSPVMVAAMAASTTTDQEKMEESDMDEGNPLGLLSPKCEEILRRRRLQIFKPTQEERRVTDTEQTSTILNLLLANPAVLASAG